MTSLFESPKFKPTGHSRNDHYRCKLTRSLALLGMTRIGFCLRGESAEILRRQAFALRRPALPQDDGGLRGWLTSGPATPPVRAEGEFPWGHFTPRQASLMAFSQHPACGWTSFATRPRGTSHTFAIPSDFRWERTCPWDRNRWTGVLRPPRWESRTRCPRVPGRPR
jgi:hypothetical protein